MRREAQVVAPKKKTATQQKETAEDLQGPCAPPVHGVAGVSPHTPTPPIEIPIPNPFHPADRDTIFQRARQQLAVSARDLAVRDHAEQSARLLMQGLFAAEGWTVEVEFGLGEQPAGKR